MPDRELLLRASSTADTAGKHYGISSVSSTSFVADGLTDTEVRSGPLK
jgi:hypothetical protein